MLVQEEKLKVGQESGEGDAIGYNYLSKEPSWRPSPQKNVMAECTGIFVCIPVLEYFPT